MNKRMQKEFEKWQNNGWELAEIRPLQGALLWHPTYKTTATIMPSGIGFFGNKLKEG